MDTEPLAARLPNQQVIFNLLLFKYIVIPLSLGRYSIIYKVHIICKVQYLLAFISNLYIISNVTYKSPVIIYKLVIICKDCNNPYKQGPIAPSSHYKY